MTRCPFLVLAFLCAFSPATAAAQSADPPEKPELPAISVSVAAGPMEQSSRFWPVVIAGVQFPLGRWARLEGEVARSTATNLYAQVNGAYQSVADRRALATSVNVLFRAGTPRFAGFVGGGAGIHMIRSRFDEDLTPRSLSMFRSASQVTVHENRAGLHIVGGAEIPFARRILGFASFRAQLLPEPNVGVTAGARVALTQEKARAGRSDTPGRKVVANAKEGQEVRVTMRTGERRTGRLVSLSSSEVAMSWGKNNTVIPLRDVRRIETVSHHARQGALIGLFAGIGWALGVCTTDDNFCGDDASFPLLASFLGGMGTGIGASVGGMMNAATVGRHVLYENSTAPVATVSPILGAGKAGVALRLRW